MRVVHILSELRPSGAEVMLKSAAPYWMEKGLTLSIIACAETVGTYADELEEAGYQVRHCRRSRGWGTFAFIKRLGALIRDLDPDAIHIHCEAQSLVISAVARRSGVAKVVRTIHNNFPFRGALRIRKAVERRLISCMGVEQISIGKSVSSTEEELLGNSVVEIGNWIDTACFRPPSAEERAMARREIGIGDDVLALVSVGNGSAIKNYATIVKALTSFPDGKLVYFQVGGEHPSKLDRKIAEEEGVSNKVVFVGPVKNVRQYLWGCDGFVMPSLFEGNSIAAAEALATGISCVFTRVAGLRDWEDECEHITWAETPSNQDVRFALERWFQKAVTSGLSRVQQSRSTIERMSAERGAGAYLRVYKDV